MKNEIKFLFFLLMCLLTSQANYAQEDKLDIEESSEVFLEEYTDEFQETFFEALKQKGIQNYDRATNLLLECKRIEAYNIVVDHELAKVSYLDKKYVSAQKYAVEALISEPENYWYLDTLVSILEKQSSGIEAVKSTIPYDENKLQENLALIYYKKEKYKEALKILDGISSSKNTEELSLKLNEALNKQEAERTRNTKSFEFDVVSKNEPSTKGLEMSLKSQIKLEQYRIVENTARDAVEEYPLQPFFYYAHGLALHKNNKNREAVTVLESALDYLFDDISLANKIYKTLGDAYTKLNNNAKANLYFNKIKPGF